MEDKWISVSELATLKNVSKQTIYNRIKSGEYESRTFKRGLYNGILVKLK